MLSRFFGKSDKVNDSPTKESQVKRGADISEAAAGGALQRRDNALSPQPSRVPPKVQQPVVRPAATVFPAPSASPPEGTVDFDLGTDPVPLQELTLDQRKETALATVERYHQRIANTIRTLWGYKECGVYINKLIMAGGDGMGHARVGFNQEAVQAMLELSDLHDAAFGPPDAPSGGLGLSI